MSIRKWFNAALLLPLVLLLAACGNDAEENAVRTIRLGLSAADGAVETHSVREFSRLLEEYSNGTFKTEILAAGLAGGEREIVEAQQLGTMDMSVISGILQNFDPAMMILEYDFLFVNEDHVRAVFEGEVGKAIYDRVVETTGIRILSMFMRTPSLMTTNRPINSIDDLTGLKIRVPEMAARITLWTALGANPTPMSFPEVYTALQTKVIDGQENPITLITSSKFYEVVDYLAITNHVYGFMFLSVTEELWQSLTVEQRGWFEKAAAEATLWNDARVKELENEELAYAMERMTVTYPDTTLWRARVSEVYQQFLDVEGFAELYNAIVEVGHSFE